MDIDGIKLKFYTKREGGKPRLYVMVYLTNDGMEPLLIANTNVDSENIDIVFEKSGEMN